MITLFGDSKANMPLKIWREMYSSKEADDTMGHEVDVANYYSKKQEVSNQTTKRREVVVWGGVAVRLEKKHPFSRYPSLV